jgi:hypothetical protein
MDKDRIKGSAEQAPRRAIAVRPDGRRKMARRPAAVERDHRPANGSQTAAEFIHAADPSPGSSDENPFPQTNVLNPCPPKAKVTSSNLVGRANQINDLRKSSGRGARGKLTTNSPIKCACWRVIGGDFVTLLP